MKLYYCDGDKCLDGSTLGQMVYACRNCYDKPKALDKLSDNVRKKVEAAIDNAEKSNQWGPWPDCECGGNFPVVPRCPNCHDVIGRHGWYPPFGLWGASSTGKSVFSAVLYDEIATKLHNSTDMTHSVIGGDSFKQNVVLPLYRGILPEKTAPSQHNKLVIKLRGASNHSSDWLGRSLTLTDMAGEVYELTRDYANDEAMKKRRDLILRSKESIFLINPQGSGVLGANMRQDYYVPLCAVFELPQVQDILRHQAEIPNGGIAVADKEASKFVHLIEYAMRNIYHFPSDPRNNGYYDLSMHIANEILQTPNPNLSIMIQNALQETANKLSNIPRLQEQIDKVAQFLKTNNPNQVGNNDDKIQHRIAITIAKSDLLDKTLFPSEALLQGIIDKTFKKTIWKLMPGLKKTSRKVWLNALNQVSEANRDVLRKVGENDFVDHVERVFTDVGFFFISSLGTDTEVFPVSTTETIRPGGRPGTAAAPGANPQHEVAGSQTSQRVWTLKKRVSLHSMVTQSRSPLPQGVLWPLLWVLAGG